MASHGDKQQVVEAFTTGLWSTPDNGHDPLAVFADDVRFRVEVLPQPVEFTGVEQMRRFREAIGKVMPDYSQVATTIHQTADPDLIIFEADGRGTVEGGAVYEQHYVYLLTLDGDRVALAREYGNPYKLFEVMDAERLQALVGEVLG